MTERPQAEGNLKSKIQNLKVQSTKQAISFY